MWRYPLLVMLTCLSTAMAAETVQKADRNECNNPLAVKLRRPYFPIDGKGPAFYVPFEKYSYVADDNSHPTRSPFVLCEDGKLIGYSHAMIDQINSVGSGLHTHYANSFVFSSSDNSDPNFNNRVYTAVPVDEGLPQTALFGTDTLYRVVERDGGRDVETIGVLTNRIAAEAVLEAMRKQRPDADLILMKGSKVISSSRD